MKVLSTHFEQLTYSMQTHINFNTIAKLVIVWKYYKDTGVYDMGKRVILSVSEKEIHKPTKENFPMQASNILPRSIPIS